MKQEGESFIFTATESKMYNAKKLPIKDNAVFFENIAIIVATEDAKNTSKNSASI